MSIKLSNGQRLFNIINIFIMLVLMVITVYPLLFVLFASISNPSELMRYRGILWKPIGFTLEAYNLVLKNPMISISYGNTLFYVIVGTSLNMIMTANLAYVLSRKGVYWNKLMMFLVVFTMFFSGGLIPQYLLIKNLGLLDNRFAIILPTLINTWNLIIMRTSFKSIPDSMEESARLDGANDFIILFRIIIPLSKAVMAVMVLYYGVYHWNSWFHSMIYFSERSLFPLQLILREILIVSSNTEMLYDYAIGKDVQVEIIVKYATIVVATVPILLLYPFLQKYFVKGVMIGALKG